MEWNGADGMSCARKSCLDPADIRGSAVILTATTIVPIIGTTPANTPHTNATYKLNPAVIEDALAFVTHAVPTIGSGWGPAVVVPIDT